LGVVSNNQEDNHITNLATFTCLHAKWKPSYEIGSRLPTRQDWMKD